MSAPLPDRFVYDAVDQIEFTEAESSGDDAAEPEHTGAMVALVPSPDDIARLVVDGGEPADELHLTLMYLGEAADIPDAARSRIVGRLRTLVDDVLAAEHDMPIVGNGFAVSAFNPTADDVDTAVVLGVGGDDLDAVHGAVADAVDDMQTDPGGFTVPDQHSPWVAHVTLAYSDDLGLVEQLADRTGPISFDRLRVAFGDDVTDIPLTSSGGALMGDNGTGAVTAAAEEKECPPGQHRMPDGECMPDEDMPAEGEAVTGYHFHALMIVEGVSTGMRTFAEGGLDWRTPPFAFRWQLQEPEVGGHALAVHVGNVELVERRNSVEIHGWGRLDLDDENGVEFARKLASGFAPWVSVGLDEQPVDVEMVWPDDLQLGADNDDEDPEGQDDDEDKDEDEEEGPAGLFDMLFAEPEQMIFHSGRIAELTAVTVPALPEAKVEALPPLLAELQERGVMVASAVGSHDTGTADEPWDKSTHEKRLPSPMKMETARKMYAWIEDGRAENGEIVKDACKFPHHNVSADGSPGAANLTACSTGIGFLNGGRGGTNIPAGDRQGVYNHLAKHMRDGGQEPPEAKFAVDAPATVPADVAVVAAAHVISIPDLPPAEWFAEPVDVPLERALTVTDEGRLYGLLAPFGTGHRAFRDRRVEAPRGNVDYARWMGTQAIVAGGGRVDAGPITMECGHYPPTASRDTTRRMEHYQNSCSVVAKAAIGENDQGVWIAGALEPGITADQVSRLMACRLSGDWGPHPDRPGWQEFVAALAVPVPGFARAPSGARASTRVRDGVMVAAAVPVTYQEGPPKPLAWARTAMEALARSIGRDATTRMAELRQQVHQTEEETHV